MTNSSSKSNPRQLRLIAFNILEGLRPVKPAANERRLVDRDRAKAVRELVDEYQPDFLALNEALYCRIFADKKVNYSHLFKFPHHECALYDDAWGNAILSKHPIIHSSEMRIYNRGGLIIETHTNSGPLTIASYHPHPARYPENKAEDFAALVEGIKGPVIICGDFNCISPDDTIDYPALTKAFASFSTDPKSTLDRFIESGKQVFSRLEQLGFHDAIPKAGRRYSIPTDLLNRDKSSAMRIDHILVNDKIKVLSGEVIHSDASNRASDHHPVMIDFSL